MGAGTSSPTPLPWGRPSRDSAEVDERQRRGPISRRTPLFISISIRIPPTSSCPDRRLRNVKSRRITTMSSRARPRRTRRRTDVPEPRDLAGDARGLGAAASRMHRVVDCDVAAAAVRLPRRAPRVAVDPSALRKPTVDHGNVSRSLRMTPVRRGFSTNSQETSLGGASGDQPAFVAEALVSPSCVSGALHRRSGSSTGRRRSTCAPVARAESRRLPTTPPSRWGGTIRRLIPPDSKQSQPLVIPVLSETLRSCAPAWGPRSTRSRGCRPG